MPDRALRRRNLFAALVLAAMIGFATVMTVQMRSDGIGPVRGPIKVGVLHSLTGTMAVSERTVVDATLFAIEELNAAGGVLGRTVEPIVVDGRSDWPTFAAGAERLIGQNKVSAIFGCWTSACRKTVKPIFENRDAVLFYPVQYEGLEQSPNIVYTGAAPNQQIIPAIKWTLDHLGKRIFLIGSDYVFPRTANKIISLQVTALQGEIVGDEYVALGGQDFDAIIAKIKAADPDVIFNTINGDSNIGFYKALRAAGITAEAMPVMSFSVAEAEVKAIGPALMEGDYAARNYFQTVDTPENKDWVRRFKARFGQDYVTTAPMEAAYYGVHLWAKAVTEARSADWRDYRSHVRGQSMMAPGGLIQIDTISQHVWKTVRIGKIQADGSFAILWDSGRPIRPVPFPTLLSQADWLAFLDQLYKQWGGQWSAP